MGVIGYNYIVMNTKLASLSKNITRNKGADNDVIKNTSSQLDFILPDDYLEFIHESNGGEGTIGEMHYLSLWEIEELTKLNKDYDTEIYAPGYFIFGSDGGGTAYAFDKTNGNIVSFQFIGMLMEDEPQLWGNSFTAFLENLSVTNSSYEYLYSQTQKVRQFECMSIDNVNVIDFVSVDKSGNVVLTISDHLAWDQENEHVLKLQEKINAYLNAIDNESLYESYPDAKGRRITISLVMQFWPNEDGKIFLERVGSKLQSAGYSFTYKLLK
jgi:hypothetical protein